MAINITADQILITTGIILNISAIVGYFTRIERRLTRLETQMEAIIKKFSC